jgi:hypothetical protein
MTSCNHLILSTSCKFLEHLFVLPSLDFIHQTMPCNLSFRYRSQTTLPLQKPPLLHPLPQPPAARKRRSSPRTPQNPNPPKFPTTNRPPHPRQAARYSKAPWGGLVGCRCLGGGVGRKEPTFEREVKGVRMGTDRTLRSLGRGPTERT